MEIHTASEGISLAKKLETTSAGFYEEAARLFPEKGDTFLAFARENRANVTQIERAYYGVITDAIEGCYAFNLDPAKYELDTKLASGAGYRDILDRALKMEDTILDYYNVAAEQCKPLMADVPQAFLLVVRKRKRRMEAIKSLL